MCWLKLTNNVSAKLGLSYVHTFVSVVTHFPWKAEKGKSFKSMAWLVRDFWITMHCLQLGFKFQPYLNTSYSYPLVFSCSRRWGNANICTYNPFLDYAAVDDDDGDVFWKDSVFSPHSFITFSLWFFLQELRAYQADVATVQRNGRTKN